MKKEYRMSRLIAYIVSSALLMGATFYAFTYRVQGANRWEKEIQQFEKADRKNPPAPGKVLFVGSSSIRLWKDIEKDFPDVPLLNRGFGGSHLADSTYFAERIILPYRPRLILLYAGDNDLKAGKTPERVFADYQEFVRIVRKALPDTRIAYLAIKPSPSRWNLVDKVRAVNSHIEQFCSKEKNLLYIDTFTPLLSKEGKPRPELYIKDLLHLNRAGYAIWKKVIAPYLKETG